MEEFDGFADGADGLWQQVAVRVDPLIRQFAGKVHSYELHEFKQVRQGTGKKLTECRKRARARLRLLLSSGDTKEGSDERRSRGR